MTPPERTLLRHSRADLRRKAVIAVIVAVCAALLLVPLGLAVDRLWVTWLAIPCAVAAAVALRRRVIPDCPRPRAGEVALAAATATYLMATVAFAWWVLFWVLHWLLQLAESALSVGIDEDHVAWIVTLILFGPTMVYSAGRAGYEMQAELYPATGLRSRYRDVIRFRGKGLMWRAGALVLGLVVFIVVANLVSLGQDTTGGWVLVILVLSASTFAVPAGAQRVGGVRAPDVKRVADGAEAVGWHVLANPQTGDVGIDPYLAEVDLFASKGSLSVVMKVVQGDPSSIGEGRLDPVGWPIVATVLTAARSLPPDQLPAGVKTVEPVLVLIDAELQPEPLLFAAQNGVALLSVDAGTTSARARGVPRLEEELRAIGDAVRASRAEPRGVKRGAAA